jgi:hypothetical protein
MQKMKQSDKCEYVLENGKVCGHSKSRHTKLGNFPHFCINCNDYHKFKKSSSQDNKAEIRETFASIREGAKQECYDFVNWFTNQNTKERLTTIGWIKRFEESSSQKIPSPTLDKESVGNENTKVFSDLSKMTSNVRTQEEAKGSRVSDLEAKNPSKSSSVPYTHHIPLSTEDRYIFRYRYNQQVFYLNEDIISALKGFEIKIKEYDQIDHEDVLFLLNTWFPVLDENKGD